MPRSDRDTYSDYMILEARFPISDIAVELATEHSAFLDYYIQMHFYKVRCFEVTC